MAPTEAPAPGASPALAARAAQAVRWSALTTAARFALQLGAQVALARLLGPANYGVYGLGITVLTFAGFLAGTGFSYSLMLRERIDERDIRFAFTWQLLSGAACALAMALAAPALAAFFGMPALAPTLRWLALACLLTAASGTAQCLLQRELALRTLGLLQLAAYAIGYLGLGLPLALAGWQAQALALACVAQSAAALALAWACRPHPLRPLWRHDAGRQALATGRTVFITNLVNWMLANLDRLVIGRWLAAPAVGLYTVAWNLAQVPVTLLMGAAQPALLAAGARLAGDREALARGWRLVLAGALVLMPPLAASLALLAPDLVGLLYGPQWAEAGWLLALMLLCLPAWTAWGLSTPVLWNTGRAALEARLQGPLLALAVPAWWLLAPQGLRWVAGLSALLVHARAAVTVAAGLRALGLHAALLLPLAGRGLALAALCGAAAAAGRQGARAGLDGWVGLGGSASAAAQAGAMLAGGGAAAFAAGLLVAWTLPGLLGEASALLPARRPARRAGVRPPAAAAGRQGGLP